jgi:hypothetical protein
MDLDKAMIVAGVGCRRGAAAPDIEAPASLRMRSTALPPPRQSTAKRGSLRPRQDSASVSF